MSWTDGLGPYNGQVAHTQPPNQKPVSGPGVVTVSNNGQNNNYSADTQVVLSWNPNGDTLKQFLDGNGNVIATEAWGADGRHDYWA